MNDIESQLRATLDEHAKHAPTGEDLAMRILAEVDAPAGVLRPRHGWGAIRTWTLPLLAAGTVAAVVATVLGVSQLRHDAAPAPAVSHLVPSPSHPVQNKPAPTTAPTPTPTPTHSSTVNTARVSGFQALDVTFASIDHGWALGSADCVLGSGRCSAMFRTTDGATWSSMPGTAFNVPGVLNCADPCVRDIRFATDLIGYAYGPAALFMTTDGGLHWTRQAGRGAEALETLNGNVVRLVADGTGCPGPCHVRVETAPIGSSTWATAHLQAGDISPVGVILSRSGAAVYVLATRNPASGAVGQTSTLYVSTDNGATWRDRGEPCESGSGSGSGNDPGTTEVDSIAVAGALNGAATALCAPRDGTSPVFVVVSHDNGASFVRSAGTLPRAGADLLSGDPASVLVAAGTTAYRSVDGGSSWEPINDIVDGPVTFLGFESTRVGRAVTRAGRTIWTTRDDGRSWSEFNF